MGICVVAVDIGSAGPSLKFAWAAFDAPERQVMAAGTDPETAVPVLVPGLLSGARAQAHLRHDHCWMPGLTCAMPRLPHDHAL
jgi:hypothetical protein